MSFLLYNFSKYKGSDFFVIDNSFFMFFLINIGRSVVACFVGYGIEMQSYVIHLWKINKISHLFCAFRVL